MLTLCQQAENNVSAAAAVSPHNRLTIETDKVKSTMTTFVPDYANLRLLPTGSTISLWEHRDVIYNAQHIPSSILLPEDKKEMAWNDVLDNDKSYCFTAMTMPEYKTLVNDNGTIEKLPGGIRAQNGWEQLILLPTSEEAVQWLAYHQSMGHTMACDQTVVMAVSFDPHNLTHHNAVKKTSSFQRGYSVQVIQVHSPCSYRLTEWERNNLRTMVIDYNAAQKFQEYNWSSGWIWLYGHTMHVQSMLTIGESCCHHTIFQMGLEHLGQFGQTQLPESVQLELSKYKTNCKLDTYHVGIPRRQQRGHIDHFQYIMDKMTQATMQMEAEDNSDRSPPAKRLRDDKSAESENKEGNKDGSEKLD